MREVCDRVGTADGPTSVSFAVIFAYHSQHTSLHEREAMMIGRASDCGLIGQWTTRWPLLIGSWGTMWGGSASALLLLFWPLHPACFQV